jgi:hypothetical protein
MYQYNTYVQVQHVCTSTTRMYKYNTYVQVQHVCTSVQHVCTSTTRMYKYNTYVQVQHVCTSTTRMYKYNTYVQHLVGEIGAQSHPCDHIMHKMPTPKQQFPLPTAYTLPSKSGSNTCGYLHWPSAVTGDGIPPFWKTDAKTLLLHPLRVFGTIDGLYKQTSVS